MKRLVAFEVSMSIKIRSWTPILGKRLICKNELGNPRDRYAVAIINCTGLGRQQYSRKFSLENICNWRLICENRKSFPPRTHYTVCDYPHGGCILLFTIHTHNTCTHHGCRILPFTIRAHMTLIHTIAYCQYRACSASPQVTLNQQNAYCTILCT